MSLTLRVVRYQGSAPTQTLSVSVNQQPVVIGRRPDCDLILPDPERFISSQHACIAWNSGTYQLTDTSTNGTYVNHAETPVGQDNSVQINDGDEINIGDYDIEVNIGADAAEAVATIPPALQDPFGSVPPATPEPPAAIPPEAFDAPPFAPQPPPLEDPSWGSDEALDPLRLIDGPGPDPFSPPDAGSPLPPAEDFGLPGDLQPEAWSGQEASASDHTPADQVYFTPPQAIPDNWDVLDDTPTEPDAPRQIEPAPPLPPSTTPPSSPPAQAPASPSVPTAAEADAARMLLAGLGLEKVRLGDEETLELMRLVGELLREMTEGVMRILINRASLKNQMRMNVTTIKAAENNPLKFSTGAEDALNRLLVNPGQGYLPPREAVREAIGDLQVHEMALMAGLRAALEAQFARFAPQRLEKGLKQSTLRSTSRKAKCWDLFTELYAQIQTQAEDDSLRLSGDAFMEAYEGQVRQLKAARNQDTS